MATGAATSAAHATPSLPQTVAGIASGQGGAAVAPVFDEPDKSFAVYVGKNLTEDGYPMLGGFGHEPSSHWVEVVPAQEHPEGAEITVGATAEADMPGQLSTIPQVPHTYRYITSNYSEFTGLPAPLTNGGLNEKNVAARDVWSNSRAELLEMTPQDQSGPQYSDLSRIAMERAGSAREAVEILGELIDEYGYTTYGGNSHLFADENEGWVFIEYAGGQGLWAAERLGADEVRVSYPGYIHEFPVAAVSGNDPDFLGSANLVSFAQQQGWYDPSTDASFNLQTVYQEPFPTEAFDIGDVADAQDPAPYRHPVSLEAEFAQLAPAKLEDVMRIVRDPRWSDDRSGYGHVAQLRDDLPDPSLTTLWVAPTAAATAPYIPISIGTTELPIELSQHRYLTAGASATYLDPAFAEQEATEYATQTFKRLMYATCARPDQYLSEVTRALEGYDAQSIARWDEALAAAQREVEAGRDPAGALTDETFVRALDGLRLGNFLLSSVLERSFAAGGIAEPEVERVEGEPASARSLPMDLRSSASSRDRMNCDVGGGWPEGSTLERAGTYGDPADVPDFSAVALPGRPASDGGALPVWAWTAGGVAAGAILTTAAAYLLRRRS
ncbi:C69 family dipeptidase [Leucobacter sp. HY1910]